MRLWQYNELLEGFKIGGGGQMQITTIGTQIRDDNSVHHFQMKKS